MLTRRSAWVSFFFVALSTLVMAGCAGSKEAATPFEEIQLNNIYEIYQHVLKSKERPPADLSDLTQPQYGGAFPVTVRELQEGKYLVVFGVAGRDGNIVLAYDRDVPVQGGAVLMADGAIRKMTADQFKSAQSPP